MFKVQKINPSSQLQSKNIRIPKLPLLNVNVQTLSTLNYDIDQILQIIQSVFLEEYSDKNSIIKALKIVSASLADSKLITKLQSLLTTNLKKVQQIYELFCLWTTFHQNIQTVLAKLSPKLRKQIATNLLLTYFLKNNHLEEGIKKSLFKLIALVDPQNLISQLKNQYHELRQPLKVSILKCMNIKTQNAALKQIINKWIQLMLEFSEAKVVELVQNIDSHKQLMEYLILNVPKMSSTFIRNIKKTVNQNNVLEIRSKNAKINSIFKSAVQEWINENHNFWKVIDKQYATNNFAQKAEILKLGKSLNKQFQLSEYLTVQYLYFYFQNQFIQFDKEDALIASQPHQNWMDVYSSIYQCTSHQEFNLIVMNVNSAPKNWKQQNPFQQTIKNKLLKKFINKFEDFYEQLLKEYSQKNKKIQLVFSSFLVYLKDTDKYITVTFDQLKSCIEQNKPIDNLSFRDTYRPFIEQSPKLKQQNRKQHNIIIEAKLVKILKKHKQSMTITNIAKQLSYSEQIIELALKRLLNKGIVEVDQKNKDQYIYVP